jgi:hypothetical protein
MAISVVVLGAAPIRLPGTPTLTARGMGRITQAGVIGDLHLLRMTQSGPGLHHRGVVEHVGGVR